MPRELGKRKRRLVKVPKRAFIATIMKVVGNVNADIGIGTRIPLKKILTWRQETKAFVSARCIRRCIRERLFEKGLNVDPLQMIGRKEAEQLGDIGDPLKFDDDDLFGFLVPEEPPRRRSSPVRISHLISIRHTEVKPEFAARFPRDFLPEFQKEFPVPFEIEVAEWLGRLETIISDRIGRFEEDELKKEYKSKLEKRGKQYYLDYNKRCKRLKAFLEILIWEGWQFPRAAQSPSVPEFYYSIISLTERFIPIFGYVTVNEEDKLSQERLDVLKKLYGPLIDHLFVLDYRGAKCWSFKRSDNTLGLEEEGELNAASVEHIIKKICDYIIPPPSKEA